MRDSLATTGLSARMRVPAFLHPAFSLRISQLFSCIKHRSYRATFSQQPFFPSPHQSQPIASLHRSRPIASAAFAPLTFSLRQFAPLAVNPLHLAFSLRQFASVDVPTFHCISLASFSLRPFASLTASGSTILPDPLERSRQPAARRPRRAAGDFARQDDDMKPLAASCSLRSKRPSIPDATRWGRTRRAAAGSTARVAVSILNKEVREKRSATQVCLSQHRPTLFNHLFLFARLTAHQQHFTLSSTCQKHDASRRP